MIAIPREVDSTRIPRTSGHGVEEFSGRIPTLIDEGANTVIGLERSREVSIDLAIRQL